MILDTVVTDWIHSEMFILVYSFSKRFTIQMRR
jgi:hypothetical protein